jgi:ABC-2 type transport system ATP-binding protein
MNLDRSVEGCAIATHELTRRFGALAAVQDVGLEVPRGSVYGFLGLNGAGKTTTIRMLLGLLRPTRGSVTVLGFGMPSERMDVLGRVGALVEAPTAYPHLTGFENLEATRRLLGAHRDRIIRALEIVGLTAAANRLVREYSTGMRQRLGLALALLAEPRLLVLDEPTNGLDPAGIQEVRELIRDLPGRLGVTVFLSSHILAEVEQVATHVGIIHRGRLVVQGRVAELLEGQLLRLGARDPIGARARLVELGWSVRDGEDATLLVEAKTPEDAAAVNAALVRSGHDVFHLAFERSSLEHVFFAATREAEARAS